MLGTGIGHYIPLIAYCGFWAMSLVSLAGKPLYGLYYMIPFLPYRTMRDHFLDYPLGANMLTILVLAVIIGALIKGKHLPKSNLYMIWLIFGVYLYISLWLGTLLGNAPEPLWLSDPNFVVWKDYMVIPLVFAASGLVIEDKKAIRTVVVITTVTLFLIDRSSLMESLSRTWTTFDEDKRNGGPLAYGSNQTAAFLAQFGLFVWGLVQFVERSKYKLLGYGLVALTILANMYTFSRGGYLAFLVGIFMLGLLKDRKLLVLLVLFLATWTVVVPTPVRERVNMTHDSNGKLEASAQERVDLWENAKTSFERNPIMGTGFATFQFGEHVDNLRDTHNWYVKVLVETGVIGAIIVLFLLQKLFATPYRLFKDATDPLYKGLGLGLFLAVVSCCVANFFGDRWTYLEINGLLWILVSATIRASELSATNASASKTIDASSTAPVNQYLAYR